ncbi:hypothetical protein CVT25_003365 [Psilocybe cyanescens]|uniref:Uncharacterized protein n=1 Tax=Psilocybe cyanescens TaxID=93625 RepID=A0A409X538_PSICY|nr:hypothetical protein CVT25_003365 [Psilocybe cyanescens]
MFSFVSPRCKTGADAGQLDMVTACSFFQQSRFPDSFFHANDSGSGDGDKIVFAAHPIQPGRNVSGVNNYVVNLTSADFSDECLLYNKFANQTVRGLYPSPTGDLLTSLKANLHFFYNAITPGSCQEVFPYGE